MFPYVCIKGPIYFCLNSIKISGFISRNLVIASCSNASIPSSRESKSLPFPLLCKEYSVRLNLSIKSSLNPSNFHSDAALVYKPIRYSLTCGNLGSRQHHSFSSGLSRKQFSNCFHASEFLPTNGTEYHRMTFISRSCILLINCFISPTFFFDICQSPQYEYTQEQSSVCQPSSIRTARQPNVFAILHCSTISSAFKS